MSIPDPMDEVAAREALDYFYAAGFNEVDTAILYQGGKTEAALGKDKLAVENISAFCQWNRADCLLIRIVLALTPRHKTDSCMHGRCKKEESITTQTLRVILLCSEQLSEIRQTPLPFICI